MADAPNAGSTETAGQQQGTETTAQTGAPAGAEGSDEQGKGGKEAVLADLARERDARQAAEAAQQTFLDGLKKLIGGDTDQQLTPDQLQAKLQEATQTTNETALELALYRAGQGQVNVDALLDSRAFMSSLKGLKSGDTAGIAAKIAEVKNDPRYALQAPGSGAGDAGATGRPPVTSINDWIRNPDGR